MVLIIGGACQGKGDFAREEFALGAEDFYRCTGGEVDFSRRCIQNLEVFARENPDPVAYFEENREKWADSVLILRDISCGVVPMGAENRDWRQKTGKFGQYLAKNAQRVSRIFCGLELRLK